jgi:hypothetical protein
MKIRRLLRALLIWGCMVVSFVGSIDSVVAKTTDQSDLWWIPEESGWGIQIIQQEMTIFATMFVYGPDGKPTWYVATLNYVTSGFWTGALYATTGPWFGAPFDPSAVTPTAVGTMTFAGQFVNQAVLTYTVNGVRAEKTIQRQNLVTLNFGGQYSGTLSQVGSGAACNADQSIAATPASVSIAQADASMTVITVSNADTCTFPGTYTQGGHFGRVSGAYACASGDSGTFSIFEMAVSFYDFRARTVLNSSSGCTIKGYIDGLRQPPPPQ